jgi:hypothetical protein
MKKLVSLVIVLCVTLGLAGCGEQPLKFRNLSEADQYLRNNIKEMNWDEFKLLLDSNNSVSEEEFRVLKEKLTSKYSSSHVEVNNTLFRFYADQRLMYATEWNQKDAHLYLTDINYIKE